MIIAIPFAYNGQESPKDLDVASIFIKHARLSHPKATLIQMTDKDTKPLRGVDECFRHGAGPHGTWYFNAMVSFPADQFLRVDSDIVLQGDMSGVFDQNFDIAIAKEHNGLMNTGVVFVKDKRIFAEALKLYHEETHQDNWGDIQKATQLAINTGKYNVLRLEPEIYNYYPSKDRTLPREILYPPSCKALHFKGSRKAFMKADFR